MSKLIGSDYGMDQNILPVHYSTDKINDPNCSTLTCNAPVHTETNLVSDDCLENERNVQSVKASDYNKAVIGHVIQNHELIDEKELMADEISKLAHRHSIELISILQAYLPAILDGIAADLRMKSDVAYKCSLQPDNYKNKECD